VKLLRHFIQEHFQVRWRDGKPPPEDLAARIGLSPEELQPALDQIAKIQKQRYLDQDELNTFYQSLQPIYRLIGNA